MVCHDANMKQTMQVMMPRRSAIRRKDRSARASCRKWEPVSAEAMNREFPEGRPDPVQTALRLRPDHFLHDLAGAAVDALHAGVAPQPGDRVLVHVAGAAVQLQARVADLPLQLGVEQLGGRALGGGQLALQVAGDRPVQVRPAGLQLGLQVAPG